MKKIISILILSAMICQLLTACQTQDEKTDDNKQTDKESTVESTDEGNQADETESDDRELDIAPMPLDIETIGGVVIVGKIGFDEKGWYIVPEQPLNITYEYFLDNPSVFPNQTRISMTDPKEDGVDKSVYLGQTVTVEGEFRFVRNDFDTLYLLPYTVTIGKIAEASYGDSNLKAPDKNVDKYDPSCPLPKYMEPMIIQGKYIFNAFMLSDESIRLMGNDFASFYCDFVDAFLGYRSEVPCPNKEYAEMLSTIIYYDFPLFDACAEPFEFFKHYNGETDTITIKYKYSADEHQDLLDRFLKAGDEILAAVTPDMSEAEKAKAIYHEICTRMVYDDSALEILERKNSYYAYLNNSGVCVTFANVYNQLLTQVGIKSTIASCDYAPTMGHVWSIVTLDGKDYFCDPTFELSRDSGNGYIYFGMSYADRINDGTGKDGIRAGRYFTYTVLPEMIAMQSLAN
jgi:hypothetical protein